MIRIKKEDFINSIATGFQFISYYHPRDFIRAMTRAYEKEKSEAAKNAIAQILLNSRMAAEGKRPVCQDTGLATVFLKIGMQVQWDTDQSIDDMVNEGIRRAYGEPDNPLRASIVDNPLDKRNNTGDNTPGVVHIELVPGDRVDVNLVAKGFGSENKARLLMLNPGDDFVHAVVDAVVQMGAGWCPPGVLGIGVGGSAEKAMLLAKEALLAPIDIFDLLERGPQNSIDELRLELYDKINRLGIGAQGLGGLTTVLDIKIKQYPTHAAALPVGLIPNCAATRHIHFQLDGSGMVDLTPPSLDDWPAIILEKNEKAKRIQLESITPETVRNWKAGETLYLTGKIITGRDAAHKRLAQLFNSGQEAPGQIDFNNKLIYYVGPVPKTRHEVIGPAGPTTASRMDKYTSQMLSKTKLLGMIGKGERSDETIEVIKKFKVVYLIAVGGAAYLISKSIRYAKLIAFEDLGMEAIYELEVKDMPVVVAVDSEGNSIHKTGPARWNQMI